MLSKKLLQELRKQVGYELYSAHFYMAMEAYCVSKNLDGFANFFKVQTEEERAHARMFFDFIHRMNGEVVLDAIDKPPANFKDLLDVFTQGYKHEQFVTSRIYLLMDIATADKEHATVSFLKWFVDEQMEEEENFQKIMKQLELIGDNVNALLMLDRELAQRVFTVPAPLATQAQ
ncbi:MAG: ferritin [Firmicutes bacterium]|jgi:ferritin|nr:ferritin [Bacillota bacterium]